VNIRNKTGRDFFLIRRENKKFGRPAVEGF